MQTSRAPAAIHQNRSPQRQARSAGSATEWKSVGSPPSPQGTPEALPYPILRRLSSISPRGATLYQVIVIVRQQFADGCPPRITERSQDRIL